MISTRHTTHRQTAKAASAIIAHVISAFNEICGGT
jgi:hypothetical protein